jgi:DNA-binding NarL/FixJ family response regulator
MPKRILIVDDHAMARVGCAELLRTAGEAYEVCEAGDADGALRVLREQSVDLLVLDLSLPGRSGLELLRHLRTSHPTLPVLVMSALPERQYALHVLKAGARGYLEKTGAADDIARAVATVLAGRRYVSATATELLLDDTFGGGEQPRHGQLSQREFDVFLQLAGGRGTGEVAARMYLSPKTVSTYRTRILEKMRFETNADLTRYAIEHGLIG